MNKSRRKQLLALREEFNSIKGDVEMLRDEEQECYDNLPESLQFSSKGEEIEEWIEQLEDLVSSLDDACSEFDNLEL